MIGLVLAAGVAFAEPTVAWQLGRCQGEGALTTCVRIGQPLPEGVCMAMRDAMRREGVQRVVCARVLVD